MSSVVMDWESRLGRRLRVRDLYILSTVVKCGSMAKAAQQLAMTQPAVSGAIANLEHVLRVRLLDRNPRGIKPTFYSDALNLLWPGCCLQSSKGCRGVTRKSSSTRTMLSMRRWSFGNLEIAALT